MIASFCNKLWYTHSPWSYLLLPFSYLYLVMVRIRRLLLCRFFQTGSAVPVIVVGNLTVGGVGKTPLVITLVQTLQEKGLKVGVVSRGYGAKIKHFPYEVTAKSLAQEVGDEPLLIAKRAKCPVVISPDRSAAVQYLQHQHQVQIIISDDGLQHYRMKRDIEIIVIDGQRGLGNSKCLPAGPLREPISRLKEADLIVVNEGIWPNAYNMSCIPGNITQINTGKILPIEDINEPFAAVAGIGNPQRFYTTLSKLGLSYNRYSFPDHHDFNKTDLQFIEKLVIMTEKDVVKCRAFADNHWYYLPINVTLSEAFWQALFSQECLRRILVK